MRIRSLGRVATLWVLLSCAIAARPAWAAVPEPIDALPANAPHDSSRFLPRWVHLHAAIGVGWLASPLAIRQIYQAGQGYEAGFEVRPTDGWRLRLNGEYQTLPVVFDDTFTLASGTDADGAAVIDTVRLQGTGQGWIGAGRLEAQRELLPGVWAIGGFGGGYLTSGLNNVNVLGNSFSFEGILPGASGWVLMPTLGGTVESNFLGPTLGLEVRWTGIAMPEPAREHLQAWSIRVGWSGF